VLAARAQKKRRLPMQTHKISLKELDDLYPDDPPRRPMPVIVRHEFGTPVTNRPRPTSLEGAKAAGASRIASAWLALRMMLMVLGGVVSIAYVAALPRVLQYAAFATAALIFLLLYGMIRKYQHGR
jgi:hypothetical protein